MNLPEYRRALSEAHERFRDHLSKAQQAYMQESERAAAELAEALDQANAAFHEDPVMARENRSEYPTETEMARRATMSRHP